MERLKLRVVVDRPKGFVDRFGTYPINYGFVPDIIGGDSEKQDVYIISKKVTEPITAFEGVLVAIIHRHDDIEDKWVVTGEGESLSEVQIASMTHFMEKYFDSEIEVLQ
ncbi:inorganic diphosphatase [Lactiplantibacillus herbarum]|uniref:inorganic diphosphatase n=1 Tax=Lactiplantibacillus herbarum TaxID=1670446 RepID=UPI00064FBF10|nr:inorganic diphosphatase [Lactiplantibacillus herbarum]